MVNLKIVLKIGIINFREFVLYLRNIKLHLTYDHRTFEFPYILVIKIGVSRLFSYIFILTYENVSCERQDKLEKWACTYLVPYLVGGRGVLGVPVGVADVEELWLGPRGQPGTDIQVAGLGQVAAQVGLASRPLTLHWRTEAALE